MTGHDLRRALAAASFLAAACADPRPVVGTTTVCTSCHDAPPATGAHNVHANPQSPRAFVYGSLHVLEDVDPTAGGALRYDFGCGNCHPLDVERHLAHAGTSGVAEVELSPMVAPIGSLRGRNATAARWDPATGTCSGVYCHSSGQGIPLFAETPPWTAPRGSLGCGGCHGNPPRYPSGGAGAADANSHLDLDLVRMTTTAWEPSWEFGHFAGLPGPNHGSKHGGGDPLASDPGVRASPITCQACHFDSVDPADVRPGGTFYFDASGAYDLSPAGEAGRAESTMWQGSQCSTAGCHGGDLGRGRVLPLRHVNGRRDVVFDPRTSIPTPDGFPALVGAEPLRPYYLTLGGIGPFVLAPEGCATAAAPAPSCGVEADVRLRETSTADRVLTLALSHARYDPETKTCSSVACHLERQRQLDTIGEVPEMEPLRWGAPFYVGDPRTCNGCHPR